MDAGGRAAARRNRESGFARSVTRDLEHPKATPIVFTGGFCIPAISGSIDAENLCVVFDRQKT